MNFLELGGGLDDQLNHNSVCKAVPGKSSGSAKYDFPHLGQQVNTEARAALEFFTRIICLPCLLTGPGRGAASGIFPDISRNCQTFIDI